MRTARPAGSPFVIEMAGLPGAGKTSLVERLPVQHAGYKAGRPLRGKFFRPAWRVATASLRLALSIRPFSFYYLLRAAMLVAALPSYRQTREQILVMDQGLVQKVWSMIIETQNYSPFLLEGLVKALAPFAADYLVWVSVSPSRAAERIAGRSHGNSRFDGLQREAISKRLENLEATYMMVMKLFRKHADLPVLMLNGEDTVEANVKIISEIITPNSKFRAQG